MGAAEIKVARIWIGEFKKLMKQLEDQGKINPKRVKAMSNIKRMYNFANQSALHINEIDGIVRVENTRKEFLKRNPEFEEDLLYEVWFNLLIVATLRSYWLIEISLINLLKDVEYGRRGIVEGKENLGTLKQIIEQAIGINDRIGWDSIDITFRNSLAHGWYYRKKQNFVFYRNSKLKKGKNYTYKELICKSKTIQLYALVMGGMVGDWVNMRDFGSKDPLKKK